MRTGRIGAAVLLALALFGQAQAQAPTTAQRDAIRQSCRADYQSLCAAVPAGGQASLQCLQQNMASLSSACQSAVSAIGAGSGGTPPANRPQSAGAGGRPMEACRSDYVAFCRGIRPGGGRAMMCLREHASELSPPCQQSLMALRR